LELLINGKIIIAILKTISNNPIFIIGEKGHRGSNNAQFHNPTAICVNSKGEIIVADTYNHRIQIFNKEGQFLSKFGSYGVENGKFNYPCGITVDNQDNIYVADTFNHRIQKFNCDGSIHLKSFGSKGSNDGQFYYPRAICIDNENGNVLIADRDNHRIQIFNKEGEFISKFGKYGKGKGELDRPLGIAINSNKEIIVSENGNDRLQIFDYDGNHLKFIENEELKKPAHICLDDQDNIYVGNWNYKSEGAKIKVFNNSTGKLIHSFGEGELNRPTGVAFDPISKRILIANYQDQTICVF